MRRQVYIRPGRYSREMNVPAVAAIGASLLVLAGCGAPRPPVRLPASEAAPALAGELRVGVAGAGGPEIRRVPLEEYVEAAILSEFAPASGTPHDVARMFELQAVLARTFAVAHRGRHRSEGFDLCAATHCQLYEAERLSTSRWREAARGAARRTAGEILWHDASPAQALFHADCGGHTSAPAEVWPAGATLPYLRALADGGPAGQAHSTWEYEIGNGLMLRALEADPRTRMGGRLSDIRVRARDTAGRARRVTLQGARGVEIPGEVLREVLVRAFGPRSIRSTLFEVRKVGSGWRFSGRGFGHGVGLCQAGAYARIRAGDPPAAVLAIYYPGAIRVRLR